MNSYAEPVARKTHRCAWCLQAIEPGTKYHRQKGKYDGDWMNWAAHLPCLAAYDKDHGGDDMHGADYSGPSEMLDMFEAAGVLTEALTYYKFDPDDLTDEWRDKLAAAV